MSVAAGLLTAAVGSVLLERNAREALRSEINLRNRATAVALAVRLDDRLSEDIQHLTLVSTRMDVATLSSRASDELGVAMRVLSEFEQVVLHDNSGSLVAAASARKVVDLKAAAAEPPPAVGPQGFTVELLDIQEPVVRFAVAVENPPGTRVGVLVGRMLLEEASERLERPGSGIGGFIVDARGRIVAHADRGRVLRPERLAIGPAHMRPVTAVTGKGSRRELVALAPAALLPVGVGVYQAESAALAPATRAVRELMLILLLVIFATVLAVSVFGGYLLRPLRGLASATNRMGRGDSSVRVAKTGTGEVGLLAREFNRMAESLEQRILELQTRRQAEEQLREQARVAETLQRVAAAVSSSLELERVVEAVTDTATELTGAAVGAFVAHPKGTADLDAVVSVSPGTAADFPSPDLRELVGEVFSDGAPVRIGDVAARSPAQEPARLGSFLGVPVRSPAGEIVGGLFFGHAGSGFFNETDERLAAGIAVQAGIAIENARLYEAERTSRADAEQAREGLAVLAEASRTLASSLELTSVLRALSELIVPRIADLCVIDLVQEGIPSERVVSISDPSLEELARQSEETPLDMDNDANPVVRAIKTREPALIEVTRKSIEEAVPDPGRREQVFRMQPLSAIVVPLVRRGEVSGVVTVTTNAYSGRTLGPQDLSLMEEIALRAAVAVENAGLYSRQRGVAETLQRSLLPDRMPQVPGLLTAARYRPGGPGVEVGGDWYEVLELPGGSLAVGMGDVVGRGVKAAALMGQLRNALRAYVLEGHGPAELVDRLNRLLEDLRGDHMATLVYAVLEPESGTLRLTNAGHPPPLVVSPSGVATYLEDEGREVPLGALPGTQYPEAVIVLEPGSTLVLYTDGLVEARSLTLDEGMERLKRAVLTAPEDLEEMCDHILARCLEDRRVEDDVAILVLRQTPLTNPLVLNLAAKPGVLAPLRATLRRWLLSVGATDQEAYEILAATGEACTNAIEHAVGPRTADFELEASHDGDVSIHVRDSGKWRTPRASLRGRGLMIIEAFMDHVEVSAGERGTEVKMSRRLGREEESRT
ncbi:MAG TPA: SpoIIE family protein phosphatase [Actinomycetota bacterium]|nr:SpoIIE family protein phosphatase [Actinomycetota bacterium]